MSRSAGGLAGATVRERPSALLRASKALVDFTGRSDEQRRLLQWRDEPDLLAVRLVHGPGGQGKSRLAGQLAHTWAGQGWVVLGAYHRRDRQAPGAFQAPELTGAAGVLVVVDYAERWDTADLLTLLGDIRAGAGLVVRVVLLARPAGTWWQTLQYRIQRDLGLEPTRMPLEPLERDPALTRTGLFAAARDRFADLLGVPAAKHAAAPSALARHEAYQLVLTVHMAALAVVLGHDTSDGARGDPVEVSAFLLARERDHWEALHTRTDKPLATTPDAMGQVVYTATLTGPLSHPDGTTALSQVGIDSHQAPGQLLKDHAGCYPPVTPTTADTTAGRGVGAGAVTVLEPLYPDRLGEDFLALLTPGHSHDFPPDPWADGAPSRLLTPPTPAAAAAAELPPGPADDGAAPVWARHTLTTLIEAAARWPHLAHQQLYPLLQAHPHLALHAGGAAVAALADLDSVSPSLLETIEELLPKRHIDLDIAAAAVASQLAEHRLTTTSDPAERAHIHHDLAVRLSHAGQRGRALAESQHAVDLRRELVRVNRDAYLPGLAISLNNHATWLAEVGRRDEAGPVSQETVDLYRELVRVNRDAYLPGLATSLSNHADRLSEVGRRDEAVPVSQHAVDLRRELVRVNRDAYLPDLATSLNNHAKWLAEVGRRDEAVPVSQETVDLCRELVRVNRDAYLPDLAGSLSNHATWLSGVGRWSEAGLVSQEVVDLYRELVRVNRDAYLPGLAISLNNHAKWLAKVRRRDEAVPVSQETVDLYRELVQVNRDAYLPVLATSLNNHASHLAQVGRRDEAVPVSQETVDLYRELVRLNRDAYLPGLATSLNNHANRLSEVRRWDEAGLVSQEAVDLRRELVRVNRDAFLPDLAGSLSNHASLLSDLGRRDEAGLVSQEAVDLRRELVRVNRDAYLPDLADSLTNHALWLAQVGRWGEAGPVSQEAVDLRRELVRVNRKAYLPGLAISLNNHAMWLAQGGWRDKAVPVSQETVDLYRELVRVNRDAYLPGLATSLNNHANRLAEVGRWGEAGLVSQEAAGLYRELVRANRDAYLPE